MNRDPRWPPRPEGEPAPLRRRIAAVAMPAVPKLLLPFSVWIVATAAALALAPGGGPARVGRATLGAEVLGVRQAVPPAVSTPAATPVPRPTVASAPAKVLPPGVMPRMVNLGAPPVRQPRTVDPEPSTTHFIVVDGTSGAVLFQRNAYEPVAMASLTKIMTALLALERGNLSERVRVDVDAEGFPGSAVMGLRLDEEVSLRDLVYGAMLSSGNDAALAIAHHLGGTEAFARRMNEKAAWLGLGATHFSNPHGFDAEDHYSSPADMVTLARYVMQYPLFREIAAARSYEVQNPYHSYTLGNVNALLTAYPEADGVKTGDTPEAGRCLVGTAVRDGRRVYVAFMRSPNGAAADGAQLLEWAFTSHTW